VNCSKRWGPRSRNHKQGHGLIEQKQEAFQVLDIKVDLRGLEQLQRNARALDGTHNIPLEELFSPAFMRGCSRFSTFREMLDASPFTVHSADDFRTVPDADWDAYVRQTTRFASWEAMQQAAAVEWAKARLFR
jgi:hypothetical protein